MFCIAVLRLANEITKSGFAASTPVAANHIPKARLHIPRRVLHYRGMDQLHWTCSYNAKMPATGQAGMQAFPNVKRL